MKHLLFVPFLLSIAFIAHAGQSNSPGECLEMYRIYLIDQNAKAAQPQNVPLSFMDECLPDSARSENPQYIKLMQLMEEDKQVVALEARLLERGFVNTY